MSNVTIANDYLNFSVRQQMEVLFSIKTGSFPLYVPGFALGHSSIALTLGQFFHPLPYIASVMPGYWNGKAIEWNNFFKLLSLGLTQLALFVLLRKMRLNVFLSFLLSFIAVYNLRMVDLFRHGAALEGYTGHLILYAIIGWYFISPTKWIGPLCIIGSTYLLICSGHPEEMYYGLLGAGLFALVAPYYLSTILHDGQIDPGIVFKFWLKVGFCICLGILLSSAYVIPFYFDFIKANINRVGQDYAWADTNLDTFMGTLNNFFLPLRSELNSAFGGSSITLVAALLPVLLFFKVKIPRSVWAIWGMCLFMFLFMQGSRTPVHKFVWEYFPFASSIRVPGRISIIMPFFIMLLLTWIVKAEPAQFRFRGSMVCLKPVVILACIALSLLFIYYLSFLSVYYIFSLSIFEPFPAYYSGDLLGIPFFGIELIIVICGIALLIFLAVYGMRTGESKTMVIFIIMFTLVQLAIVLKIRSAFWIEKKHDTPTFEAMQQQKKTSLEYPYYQGGGLHSSVTLNQLKRSFAEPYLGKIFTYVIPVVDQEEAYVMMEQERLPQQVFVEGYNPVKAEAVTKGAKDVKDGTVQLVYSSFNRLRFRVVSKAPAMFGLSYPYTGNWTAWVNDEKVHIYRANGAAHAVEIPAGESLIEFRYWSNAYFWGIVISATVFAVIGIFICFRAMKGIPRIIGIIVILITSTGICILWYHSLYTGNNLETYYAWNFSPFFDTPNVAYGKKCRLEYDDPPRRRYPSVHWSDREREFYCSRIVDGDSSRCSGFITRLHNNPAWLLDLSRMRDIKMIVLHESCQNTSAQEGALNWLNTSDGVVNESNQNSPVNIRPLYIELSNDGSKWRKVDSIISPINYSSPSSIFFDKPQTARYIRIKAIGISKLLFDEVEVYGPQVVE
jgi:hypothetical protein